jgi:hypothetical protein
MRVWIASKPENEYFRSNALEFVQTFQPVSISHTFNLFVGTLRPKSVISYSGECQGVSCTAVAGGENRKDEAMKYAGLLVMPAGFILSIAAILLFPAITQRTAFVLCGLAVEAMGLVVAVRGHMQLRSENR